MQAFKVWQRLNASEMGVQQLSVSLSHASDIQTLALDAASHVSEVQSLSVGASSGPLHGHFTLEYGFHASAPLPFNASAAEMAAAIGNLSAAFGMVDVSRRALTSGYQWNVTFANLNGDPATLFLNSSGLSGLGLSSSTTTLVNGVASEVQAVTVRQANGGTFALGFRDAWTTPLAHDASADDVASALEALSTLGSLSVSRSTEGASVTWAVTFLGNGGDLPLLRADASGLLSMSSAFPPDRPSVVVRELQAGSSASLGGSFGVSFDATGDGVAESTILAYDVSASTMQSALRALGGSLNSVVVSREAYGFNGGYAWDVTFASGSGDNPLMAINTALLSGSAPYALVAKKRTGTQPEVQAIRTTVSAGSASGTFFLSFQDKATSSLAASATAAQVQTALNALPSIGAVSVSRISLGSNCFRWLVTFASPKTDGPQPLLVAGGVDTQGSLSTLVSTTTGASASVNVTRVLSGSYAGLSGSLTLEFDGRSTSVAHDASADVMATALQRLGTGSVNVTRSLNGPEAYGAYSWNVTFTGHAAPLPTVSLGSAFLSTNSTLSAQTTVVKAATGKCCLSGSVGISRNGTSSGAFFLNTTAPALQSLLRSKWGVGVTVSREADPNGGATWQVTFPPSASSTTATYAFDPAATALRLAGSVSTRTATSAYAAQAFLPPNVQTVVLQASSALSGSFELSLNHSTTGPIAADASAAEIEDAIRGILLPEVQVTRNMSTWNHNAIAWDLTFPSTAGVLQHVACDASMLRAEHHADARCSVYTKQRSPASKLGGTFVLSYMGQTTTPLRFDASSADVEAALEALSTVGDVTVSRSLPDVNRGFEWLVTFHSPVGVAVEHTGDMPLLQLDTDGLTGTGVRGAVSEVVKGSYLGGSFTLTFGGVATGPLAYDASEEEVELALEALPSLADVSVRRRVLTDRLGHAWDVEFSAQRGDIGLLSADNSGLLGSDARAWVSENVTGSDPIRGSFTLAYEGRETAPISYNASAQDLEAALEALETVGDVAVSRLAHVDDDGYSWAVTFSTLGAPSNVGDLPLLQANSDGLTGNLASLEVVEVVPGCCAVELSFNGRDFTQDGAPFGFDASPLVLSVAPVMGPSSGGAAVRVSGTGFVPHANLTSPPMVFCSFGGHEVAGEWISASEVECLAPAHPPAHVAVTLRALASNGSFSLNSRTVATFQYHEDVSLSRVTPDYVGLSGGTYVTIYGSGFLNTSTSSCAFDAWADTNATANGTLYSGLVLVPADVFNSTTVGCRVPAYANGLFSHLTHFSGAKEHDNFRPPLRVAVTNNGRDLSPRLPLRYSPTPKVASVMPTRGSHVGGTKVTVYGEGFWDDAATVFCGFGDAPPVKATWLKPSALQCVAPAHADVASVQEVRVKAAALLHEVQQLQLTLPDTAAATIAGHFTLSLEEHVTVAIHWNATATEIHAALSQLPNVGKVSVMREDSVLSDPARALLASVISWTVHFEEREGDVPSLFADASTLTGATDGVAVTTRTLVNGHMGPAVPEVHVIRTSRAPLQAEVQRVRLWQRHVADEVQRIRLAASNTLTGSFVVASGSNGLHVAHNITADEMAAVVEVRHPRPNVLLYMCFASNLSSLLSVSCVCLCSL